MRKVRIFLRGMLYGMDPSLAFSAGRERFFEQEQPRTTREALRDDLHAVAGDWRNALARARSERSF